MDDLEGDFLLRDILERVDDGFERALDIAFDDRVEGGFGLRGDAGEEVLESGALRGRELRVAEIGKAFLAVNAGGFFRFHHDEFIAGIWKAAEAKNLNWSRGSGFLHGLAHVVDELFHLAPVVAANEHIAVAKGAHADDDCSSRATALLDLCLNDGGTGVHRATGFEFEHFGFEEHEVEEFVDAGAFGGADRNTNRIATPVLGSEALLLELFFDAIGIGGGEVDFVDGDHDFHLRGLGVGNGLEGLRHEAVIGSDDDDHDVGDIGTAGAHGGESGVAGGVEESDFLTLAVHTVGADVLGDATRFAGGHAGFADRIEERGFAMVDMAHESNDRGAGLELVDEFLGLGSFWNFDLLLDLVMAFGGVFFLAIEDEAVNVANLGDDIGLHGLVEIRENLQGHEVLDKLEGLEAEKFGEDFDADRWLNLEDFFP